MVYFVHHPPNNGNRGLRLNSTESFFTLVWEVLPHTSEKVAEVLGRLVLQSDDETGDWRLTGILQNKFLANFRYLSAKIDYGLRS